MLIIRFIIMCIILSAISHAQYSKNTFIKQPAEVKLKNENHIKMIIAGLERFGQQNRIDYFIKNKSDEISKKDSIDEKIQCFENRIDDFKRMNYFRIDSIDISINGTNAIVECIVNDEYVKHKKEQITLSLISGKWKITNSSFLIKYLLERKGDSNKEKKNNTGKNSLSNYFIKKDAIVGVNKTINNVEETYSSNNYNISNFVFSETALNKRSLIYTDLQTGPDVLNSSLTKQYMNEQLLFRRPVDGKLVRTYDSEMSNDENGNKLTNDLTIVADYYWDRIIYGSYKNQVVRSYGDNSDDFQLIAPKSVQMDKYKNIYVLANIPRKLYKLWYNTDANTDKIEYKQEIPLNGISDATDISLEWLGMNDTDSDDKMWITSTRDNSISRISLDGSNLGQYTRIFDPSTFQTIYLNHPTKVLAEYSRTYPISTLAIIDSDKKRLIIVYSLQEFQSDMIIGNCSIINFSNDLNVSLSSIGVSVDNQELWVADENNGMFHIFDGIGPDGYLCSIKTINGESQWVHPKCMLSTAMSNSYGPDYLALLTFDDWNDSQGINTYFLGTDLVSPEVGYDYIYGPEPNPPGAIFLDVKIPTMSEISYNIYDPNSNLILNSPTSLYYSGKFRSFYQNTLDASTLLGKYHGVFNLTPFYGYNSSTINKEIWFAWKPCGTISEPIQNPNQTLTFNISMSSGSGDFSYKWYRQDQGSSSWNELSSYTSSTCTQQYNNVSFTIRCDITDNFNGQTLSLTQPFQAVTKSGTLTAGEIWSGTVYLGGNVTVPANITLTINPGTNIVAGNGYYLNVFGTLLVNGTSSEKVTFDFLADNGNTNNGIRFYSGSNASVINWAIIKNAHYGSYVTVSNPTINNTLFYHNYIGIYAYSSANPTLTGDVFSYSTANGLHLSNSCSPILGKLSPGHNVITQNSMNGLYADYNCRPELGLFPDGGFNSIYENYRNVNNTNFYDVKTDATSYVKAQHNYWKGSPKIYLESQIDRSSPLDYNPNEDKQLSKISVINNLALQSTSSSDDDFTNASRLQMQGKYDDAIILFEKVLNNSSDNLLAAHSLIKISESYMDAGKKDFIDYLNTKIRPKHSKDSQIFIISLEQENVWLLKSGDYKQIVKNTEKIRKEYSDNKEACKHALFNELFTYYMYLRDKKNAEAVFEELSANYPNDILVNDAKAFLNTSMEELNGASNFGNKDTLDATTMENFVANYPNPFNPTTVIKYQIKESGRVTLKVYNIIGKEVQTLVDEYKDKGSYSAEFNASNLPSGVYIYEIRSNNYLDRKKMLLLK